MAALALAAVGSAVGSSVISGTILGMTGASFGWMVGSMAGSLLFPPKAPDGPRLEDKSVQVSTYGQPIPRVYGTQRLAGNVLWSTELIETATEQDGKGGPSYTTYSYRASFAVGICRGPIAGIRRIWADGNIIFDQSLDNSGPQVGYEAEGMAIYLGTESQLPDPTLQALQGDVPAYRGQAYVVFTDLQLAKFGNRLPSLTFEVVQSGTYMNPPPAVIGNGVDDGDWDPDTGYFWTHNGNKTVYAHDIYLETQPIVQQPIPSSSSEDTIQSITYAPFGRWEQFYRPPPPDDWGEDAGYVNDGFFLGIGSTTIFPGGAGIRQGGVYVLSRTGTLQEKGWISNAVVYDYGGAYRLANGSMLMYCKASATSTNLLRTGYPGPNYGTYWTNGSTNVGGTDYHVNYFIRLDGEDDGLHAAVRSGRTTPGVYVLLSMGELGRVLPAPAGFSGYNLYGVAYDSRRRQLLHTSPALTKAGLTSTQTWLMTEVTVPPRLVSPVYFRTEDAYFAGQRTTVTENGKVLELDPATFAVRNTIDLGAYNPVRVFRSQNEDDGFVMVTTSQNVLLKVQVRQRLSSLPVPLSDVVTAESALVGLQASDIDVSALAGVTVAGFAITSQGAVRSGLEQLMMAYAFDAVESGGVVKFVRRGGPVVATLDDADLAAHQPGNDVPAPLPITRAEEVELPQRITVRYSNPAADYQVGAQSAQRLTGRAMAQQGVDLPIVLTDNQARQIAEAALFSSWAARSTVSFSTTLKHARLEPTDVVSVGGNTLRITRRMENADLLTFEGAFENGAVYTQAATGAAADGVRDQTISTLGKTELVFLDLPPLRDLDDNAGFYLAASRLTGNRWDGALVFKSNDGGATFEEFTLMSEESVIGYVTIPPGPWDYRNNEFDESNWLEVSVNAGQLASISELAVLNKGNVALVGKEILQFKRAELVAANVYRLSGLLRCRRGTRAEFGQHRAGDQFVLLSASSLRRTPALLQEIGLSRLYKPVTIGTRLASTDAQAFTNTARAQKPLRPVHVGGGRQANGDILITWARCNRIGADWRDYSAGHLDESVERYEIEIMADTVYNVVHRTLTSNTNSVTYTVAQQTADNGGTFVLKPATVRIYQISVYVGRGDYAEAQVPSQLFI